MGRQQRWALRALTFRLDPASCKDGHLPVKCCPTLLFRDTEPKYNARSKGDNNNQKPGNTTTGVPLSLAPPLPNINIPRSHLQNRPRRSDLPIVPDPSGNVYGQFTVSVSNINVVALGRKISSCPVPERPTGRPENTYHHHIYTSTPCIRKLSRMSAEDSGTPFWQLEQL